VSKHYETVNSICETIIGYITYDVAAKKATLEQALENLPDLIHQEVDDRVSFLTTDDLGLLLHSSRNADAAIDQLGSSIGEGLRTWEESIQRFAYFALQQDVAEELDKRNLSAAS